MWISQKHGSISLEVELTFAGIRSAKAIGHIPPKFTNRLICDVVFCPENCSATIVAQRNPSFLGNVKLLRESTPVVIRHAVRFKDLDLVVGVHLQTL